ncbi:hypothetical protein BD413DRAFT_663992 [Trametes elegans]|nr:hypothetical protein BD413DRAFT_663992 [Trametes elegans]
MSQTTKRKRARKPTKEKDSSSRQTSLLDAFGVKHTSKKTTPTASAAVSENESISLEEVIDICSSDAEPISAGVLSDATPSSAAQGSSSAQMLVRQKERVPGGSQDVPIVIVDNSPATSPARALPPKPPKALYSIFSPLKRAGARISSQEPIPRSSAAYTAPFPSCAMQHIRGPQSAFQGPVSRFPSRSTRTRATDLQDPFNYFPLVRGLDHNSAIGAETSSSTSASQNATVTMQDIAASILPAHRRYPAISRFLEEPAPTHDPDPASAESSLWNDKWRPRRADQVLGNEQSALYLRDWLLSLRLHIDNTPDEPAISPVTSQSKGKQKAGKTSKKKAKEPRGVKRPRIVRDVQKKRRRVDSEEPEDAWIADDSTDDEGPPLDVVLESEGDFIPTKLSRLERLETDSSVGGPPSSPPEPSTQDSLSQPLDTAPAFSYSPPKFGETVYNTILLAGPHGCGKTAAVYACAEELGWDVFEVYPGIGERSGAALNKLIGDVGKNHLVRQTQQQPKPAPAVGEKPARPKANFFAKRVVSDDEAEEPPTLDAHPEPEEERSKLEITPVVSQSIVLVEEADVLYKEDTNFWPALVKIIKECRRPVVLTCNDTSLVPLGDLPLQTVLHFTPCPTHLAVSYLQILSLTENRGFLDYAAAMELYEGSSDQAAEYETDLTVHPDYPHRPVPDLRRTINQLQFDDSLSRPADVLNEIPLYDNSVEVLKRMARCTEINSFVDSGLRRPGGEILRDLLSNSASPCTDDQLGYKHFVALPHDMDSALPVTFSTYSWDEAILNCLLSFSRAHDPAPRGLHDPAPDPPHPLHAAHCGAFLPVLDGVRVGRDALVRDAAAVFVDYEPWVRHMARVDDGRIGDIVASGRLEGTRRTRNSQRLNLELGRHVILDEEALEVLRRTAFRLDDAHSEIPTL